VDANLATPHHEITEQPVPTAAVNGIEIAYEAIGNGSRTVILLPGAACQMLEWLEPFCEMIAEQDCTVIRVDNRDVGLSTHFDDVCPNPGELMAKAHAGEPYDAPYAIEDMAKDTAELIKVVSPNDPAHVVGRSLGGMIGQRVAIYYPELIASLCLVASSAGNPDFRIHDEEVMKFFQLPPATTYEEQIQRDVDGDRLFSGTHFEFDEEADYKKRAEMRARSDDSNGGMRHSLMFGSGDPVVRYEEHKSNLAKLDLPVSVIHGSADNLLSVENGIDTAELIPNAKLTIVEGMAHELPSGTWPQVVSAIVATVDKAQPRN
jgi:pimeloyl-ACP methyl ester carboxylesterase